MLSPLKLLVLAVIIGAVWYAYQRFVLPGARRRDKVGRDKDDSAAERRAAQVEDMVKCRYCDTYIPAGEGEVCGRPECPGTPA